MAIKPLEILINAKDNASGILEGLNGKLKAVAAAIAAYFTIDAFVGAVRGAANFETAMSRIQAATGASAAEMAAFRAAAEAAAATSKYSATEAAGALEGLAKAGLSGKEAIAALPAAMNLAQAGDISLATASEHLTSAIFSMGLKFSDTARVADVFSKGANESKTSVDGLASAFSYAAPVAKSIGLSLEGTTAIIGQFASAGIDASRAGTALNSILSQFADPASKFREELAGIGITTTDFEKALHQLSDAGVKGEKAVRAVGLEAGPALQAALNRGMPALDELKAKLMSSEGSAAAAAKVMGDNLNGAMGKLSSAWQAVTVALGTPVLPVLKSGVDELATAIHTAVTNGTIARFGEALATAFQSAITWVRAFAAETDFKKTAADMQAFAARAGEVFDQIGQYATNAGNIVKFVYGVMSAGTNVVLGAIYGMGAVFAAEASAIQSGLATILTAFAKVTPGSISQGFKEAAAEIKLSSEATAAASKALAEKSKQSFLDVADGAKLAREGAAGLAEQSQKLSTATAGIAPATKAAVLSIEELRKAATQEGDAWLAVAEKLAVVTKATEEKAAADKAAGDAIQLLWQSYVELVQSGDLQAAAGVMRSIEKAQTDAGNAAKKSAEEVKAASKAVETAIAGIAPAAKTATDATDVLREAAIKEGDAWLAAAEKLEVAKKATDEHTASTKATAKAVEFLRDNYAELMQRGDLQAAASVLETIRKVLSGVNDEAKKSTLSAAEAAKAYEDAFTKLKITSAESQKATAASFKDAYETIRDSGKATAQDLSAAFAVYTEKAIAANGGVASAAIKAEAAMRGYKIEINDTGMASLKLITITNGEAAAFAKAADAIKTKSAAARAASDLAISGLNLRKAELDAEISMAVASGNTRLATQLKIEQKRIEIQIIQATVKAQISEAEAAIAVARAKYSELEASGNLTVEKSSEIDTSIKSERAKINESKARGESVRVLERVMDFPD
ncbi:MAG: phage tail tape measure protein [Burkholderiaceae bacterium]|nr:phage tail tape measure protein [Burkholderiaceae bacterium]MBY0454753.1 phage tail tape measure protein [Burkholderiaceae bacterium]